MSSEHWTDKKHETINDSCACGARITISAQYPEGRHNRWLEAHKVCRTTPPNKGKD